MKEKPNVLRSVFLFLGNGLNILLCLFACLLVDVPELFDRVQAALIVFFQAVADNIGNIGKVDLLLQERCDGDFVGCVEYARG